MKKIILLLVLLGAGQYGRAQVNYVLNPGFEEHVTCLYDVDGLGGRACNYWSAIDTSSSAVAVDGVLCSGEYCNVCDSPEGGKMLGSGVPRGGWYYQYPHGGNAMAQLRCFVPWGDEYEGIYYRDYALGRLYKKLTAGKSYCVAFYVVGEEESGYAINHLGAYVDDGSIVTADSVGCALPDTAFVPQVQTDTILYDTINWHKVEGSFIATGNEQFITLGNFSNYAHTDFEKVVPSSGEGTVTWYLFDDVSVIESDEAAHAGNDTTILRGDTAYIGPHETALPYMWYILDSTQAIDSNGGIHVHPDTTTTYVVQQELCGLTTYDTITVKVVDSLSLAGQLLIEHTGYSLYPNPNDGNFTLVQQVADDAPVQAEITDVVGRKIDEERLLFSNRQKQMDIAGLPPGVYFIRLIDGKGTVFTIRFVKE